MNACMLRARLRTERVPRPLVNCSVTEDRVEEDAAEGASGSGGASPPTCTAAGLEVREPSRVGWLESPKSPILRPLSGSWKKMF